MVALTTLALAAFGLYARSNASPTASTFLEPTASTANPTASGVTIDHGKAYIQYSSVPGFFLQDETSTNQTSFDYAAVNFGLLNRTYPGESAGECELPQWERFDLYLRRLVREAPRDTQYKLAFFGRHGEGYHNAAETYYGTPAWNCYWAEANGNATVTWADAHLTANGYAQAYKANAYWTRLMHEQHITPPQFFYVSPLSRCLETAQASFANLSLPARFPYAPLVKELIREGISTHTCDRRGTKSSIAAAFPGYRFDRDFTEDDELWSGVVAETSSAQDYRSTVVLDDIFSHDHHRILSFTSHSGEIGSLLRVLGHIPFSLSTGQIIPVLVKAQTVRQQPSSTATQPWQPSSWCTNGPPITSAPSNGACSCSGGVTPTAISPSLVFTTGNPF